MIDNKENIYSALQDLINRLQDAEKGFQEVAKATSSVPLKEWLVKYSEERHHMHKDLESLCKSIGYEPEVKTTFLGDLHRMFIDIKINNTSMQNQFDAVVTEIDRGASTLISDYQKVLDEVDMPQHFTAKLIQQKLQIEGELDSLIALKEEFNSVMA